jgi:hypothetical protein
MSDLLAEITKAARAYYQQLQEIQCTEADFQDWLRELSVSERQTAEDEGFTLVRTRRSFQRYCLEWRGHSMREFMSQHLSVAAFALWRTNHEFNGDLPENGG